MDGYLKQSTIVRRMFGPFVSSLDGHTRQTGLTLTQAMFQLSKAGANLAQKNAKGGYHNAAGNYWATLDATDTGTLGQLRYDINHNAAIAVFGVYEVITRERYNQLFGSTDYIYSDVRQIGGSAVQHTTGTVHAYNNAGAALALASTTSTLDRTAIREAVASTLDRAAVLATLIDDGTRLDGSRLNTCNTLDSRTKVRLTLFTTDTRANAAKINACATVDRDGLRESIFTVNRRANLSVGGTIDATSQASSATSTLDRTKIRAALLTDATRFAGARVNTCATVDRDGLRLSLFSINGRVNLTVGGTVDAKSQASSATSTLDRSKIRSALLTDNTRYAGARLNAVATMDTRTKVRAAIIDDDTRLDATRLNTCNTMDYGTTVNAVTAGSPAGSATSTLDRTKIRSALLTDATRFAGARINATCTVDTRTKLRATFLSDDTRYAGANIANLDAAVSSRATLDRAAVRDAVSATLDRTGLRSSLLTDGTRFAGARLLLVATMDTRTKLRAAVIDDNTRLDASRLNTCATVDRVAVRASILSDGTRFAGGNIDVAVSSRATLDRTAVRQAVASTIDRPAARASILSDTTRISGSSVDGMIKNFKRSYIANTMKMIIHTATGTVDLHTAGDVRIDSITAAFASDSKTRTRKKMVVT